MTPSDAEIEPLVREFQADLTTMSESDVAYKHILTGVPVVVPAPAYFEIRRLTAQAFGICPSEVLIVGSCRTGFSIKNERPYQPARVDSDIDITIVSEALFHEFWEAVFRFADNSYEYRDSSKYADFGRELTRGWIMPRTLPRMNNFPKASNWVPFFNQLGGRRLHGAEPRNINARLYRSWGRLQAYQEIMVRKRRVEYQRTRR